MSPVFRSALVLTVTLTAAALLPSAALAASSSASPAKPKAKAKVAKVAIAKLSAKDAVVTVAGAVALPKNTAAIRRRTTVAFTLAGATGKKETFSAKITAKRAFSVRRTTKLTGALGLAAQVKIGGKASGKRVTKTVSVPAKVAGPSPAGPTGTATTPTTTTPSVGETPGETPPQATRLDGLFRLEAGRQAISGAISGTYFRMFASGEAYALPNQQSTARDNTYTLLRPGTDGGLRTDVFQSPPNPAFGPTFAPLGRRVIELQTFFGTDFTVVTDATDPQSIQLGAPVPDPLPAIFDASGVLSGQVTAWNAQWNGNSFNQGTPKPDGTTPGGTTPLTGTYDARTGRFTLEWKSLIVGGPFDKFIGFWHLAGTFEAAP